MSIESWKQEFYPIEAIELVNDGASDIELIRHSLRKWKDGTSQKALLKHNVKYSACAIEDLDPKDTYNRHFSFSGNTCTLCQKYILIEKVCDNCPLRQYLGRPCDSGSTSKPNIYNSSRNDTSPMVEALENTLYRLIKLNKNTKTKYSIKISGYTTESVNTNFDRLKVWFVDCNNVSNEIQILIKSGTAKEYMLNTFDYNS
jgi:hypothetical protein